MDTSMNSHTVLDLGCELPDWRRPTLRMAVKACLFLGAVWAYDGHGQYPSEGLGKPVELDVVRVTASAPPAPPPPVWVPPPQLGTPWVELDDPNGPFGGSGDSNFQPNPGQSPRNANANGKCKRGNPAIISTGNKVEWELDFESGGEQGLYLERTYNAYANRIGIFGLNWLSSFDYALALPGPADKASVIWAYRPDGRAIRFVWNGSLSPERYYETKADPVAYIEHKPDGSYVLSSEDRMIEKYSATGAILERKTEQGVGWLFAYTNNYLTSVTHTSGRQVTLQWSGSIISQVRDPANNVFIYNQWVGPEVGLPLASVIRPGSPVTRIDYHYGPTPALLAGKSINSIRYSWFEYDAEGRVTMTRHVGDMEKYTFSYQQSASRSNAAAELPPLPPAPGGQAYCLTNGQCTAGASTRSDAVRAALVPAALDFPMSTATTSGTLTVTETNPLGKQAVYTFVDSKPTAIAGQASQNCFATFSSMTYDANGYPDLETDHNGNVTNYDYNAKGQLVKMVEAYGTSKARTTEYTWDSPINRPLSVTRVGDSRVNYTYHPTLNRVASTTITNLTANGVPSQSRATAYTYTQHPNGMLASVRVDGPRPGLVDAVSYQYSSVGDLLSVTNSLGHQVYYGNHDALGRARQVTGANNEVTNRTYDERGRVKTWASSVASITYAYNVRGLVALETRSDGSTERFEYQMDNRLYGKSRTEANVGALSSSEWTVYSYDLAGNPTSAATRRVTGPPPSFCPQPPCLPPQGVDPLTPDATAPTATIPFRESYVDYDELSRPRARRGTHGQNIRYTYDANGNLQTIKDSSNRVTTLGYDAFDRLVSVTDPLLGQTKYEYDKADRVTKITDPRNVATTYTYDGFGQLWQMSNPDSGTTSFAYDAYGRRTSMTRADGVVTNYTHDNLERITKIKVGTTEQTFGYDGCVGGVGRLCTIDDPSGSTQYQYSPYGFMTRLSLVYKDPAGTVIGGGAMNYSYDGFGRITEMSGDAPSDRLVYSYAYGKVTGLTFYPLSGPAIPIASYVEYEPYGPMTSFTYGNGLVRAESYDSDGRRVTTRTALGTNVVQGLTHTWNKDDRMTGLTNQVLPSLTQNYGYDDLGRLTSVNASSGSSALAAPARFLL